MKTIPLDLTEFGPRNMRIGDEINYRRAIRHFRSPINSTVRVRVVSLSPPMGQPVALARSWWTRNGFVTHERLLK